MTPCPAYPPADVAVRKYLVTAPDAGDERHCKAYLRSFLCSLFMSTRQQAEEFYHTGTKTSYALMARKFYNFFKDMSQRNTFYETVISNAITLHTSSPNASPAEVWKALKWLLDGLKQQCNDWPSVFCPFLLAIDEAHLLFDQRIQDTPSNYTLFSRLESVLNELRTEAFCTIFLSTATSGSKITPLKNVAASMRERDDELALPAPFTELPFDAHIIYEPLVPGKATLLSVGSLEFTAKFGRPL
jgi:hypothetical protein